MKKILIAIAAAMFATSAYANLTLATNPHNLAQGGNGACVYCHMVHNANPNSGGVAPLWSRTIRTTGYTVYTSTRLSGGVVNSATPTISLLCLSCHDGGGGTLGTLWTGTALSFNPTRSISGRTLVGPSLTNDHPVGYTYPATGTSTAESGLATRSTATGRGYTLYGATFTIECASCHEPHLWSAVTTDANYKFKRRSRIVAMSFCEPRS